MSTARIDASDQDAYWALFAGVTRYAWRLEALQYYADDDADVERFASGDVTLPQPGRWESLVHGHVTAGRPFQRVRVVAEPWSDYVTWELHAFTLNVAAGEDIRVVPVSYSDGLGAFGPDYWVIDDAVWAMAYDSDGRLSYLERAGGWIADEHLFYRGTLVSQSVPLADYLNLKLRAVS